MDASAYRSAVEERIVSWIQAAIDTSPTTEGSILLDRIRSLIARGGKRARPQLLRMTYEAYGGTRSEQLVDLGAALEMHHQFLLMHDDIIDHDTIRYDGPNIIGYYLEEASETKRETAVGMGLLAGDLLYSFAHKIIVESNSYTDAQKVALMALMNKINIDEVYGQQLDSFNLDPNPEAFSLDVLILIHTLKSARYTMQLPMQSAAILLGLGESERKKIDDFAVPFGILFQLTDDFSDYFDNNSVFDNRTKYRDYKQGKVTQPLYIGLTQAEVKNVEFLQEHLGDKELSNETMAQVVTILEECGSRAVCREQIDTYYALSHKTLDTLGFKPKSKQQFQDTLTSYEV